MLAVLRNSSCKAGETQRQSIDSRRFADIVCSPCGAEREPAKLGGACCAGAPAITSEFAYLMALGGRCGFGGLRGRRPHTVSCAFSLQILSIQTASTAEHDFGESRLHYTHILDCQHNHTPLHYFARLYWPRFASLEGFLPSFLHLSSRIAFQFLFITSRCKATAPILTNI